MAYFGIKARNEEQKLVLRALDNDKPFTFITGQSGGGKSILTQAVGLENVIETQKYKKLIYTRLQVEIGLSQGFLPGDANDKIFPFVAPFFDNLSEMTSNNNIQDWINISNGDEDKKKVFFDSIQSIRGRSLNNVYFICDESQNLDINTISAIATRAGNNSKFVFLGNFSQTDDKRLRTPEKNGLYQLLQGLYDKDPNKQYFDHINLTEVQRNPVVGIVEDILRNHDVDKRFIDLENKGNIEEYNSKYGVIA